MCSWLAPPHIPEESMWVCTAAEKWEFPHLNRAKASLSMIKNKNRTGKGGYNGPCSFFPPIKNESVEFPGESPVWVCFECLQDMCFKRRKKLKIWALFSFLTRSRTQWTLKRRERGGRLALASRWGRCPGPALPSGVAFPADCSAHTAPVFPFPLVNCTADSSSALHTHRGSLYLEKVRIFSPWVTIF